MNTRTHTQDIEVGDSPVLCMCAVHDKIWMGFEIGYLIIYEATTKRLCAQAWLRQYIPILSILHIASMKRVYVAMGNGSLLAFEDDISSVVTTSAPARVRLPQVSEYHDPSQSSTCLLLVPRAASQSSASSSSFELWVGQRNGLITVLDPTTLNVIKFIQNTLDQSNTPSYVAYLTYANLVCGINPEEICSVSSPPAQGKESGSENERKKSSVCVYGALYHGQYVTRWDTETRTPVESFNCEKHLDSKEGERLC